MILDPHVHLRDFSQRHKETLAHGFALASQLGIRGLIEMPNTSPPLTSRSTVLRRLKLAEQANASLDKPIFYALHVGLSQKPAQISEAIELHRELFPRVAGFKMYAGHSTGNMGIIAGQEAVYRQLKDEGFQGVLAVHCEEELQIHNEIFDAHRPVSHSEARPVLAEQASIEHQLELIRTVGFEGHFHVAHISTPEGVALVQAAKAAGQRVSCGVTPHHCLLNTEIQQKLENYRRGLGNLLKVNPPLRDPQRQQAMWQLLCSGQIDWIESDHAPHSFSEKHSANIPSGIPGFIGLHLLYHKLVRHLSTRANCQIDVNDLCFANVLRSYKLPWEFPATAPQEVHIAALEQAPYCEADPYPLLMNFQNLFD